MNNFQKIKDKKKWKKLLDKVLFKTFFHNVEWEEFLENQFKWLRFEHYLYKDSILLSLARYSLTGKQRLISHPFCEYGGILPLKQNVSGREFKNDLFEEFKNKLKISFHPQIPRYFQEFGLKESDSVSDTYFIEDFDKRTADEIYSNFRKTLRHSIEKAKQENTKTEKCQNEKELKDFYKLYVKTIKKHKNIPYPYSFFQFFLSSPDVEIMLAKYNDKIIAGSVFLFYNKFIHYYISASDSTYRDKKANYLILWNQIERYAGKDYKVFDFGGTGRGSSLEIFKSGWATKKYTIFQLKNFKDKGIKKLQLRNVLSFLPTFISSKLLKLKL